MRTLVIIFILLYSVVLSAQERITLLFVGDLMQHQAQINAARSEDGTYDYTDCFALIKEQISKADVAIGNLEVTLGGKPYRGYPAFSAPDEYLYAICDAGFDLMLTANNHCLDRGRKGLERTIAMLDSLHIPHIGTYLNQEERNKRCPLIIEKKGFRIALINYTYDTNGLRPSAPNIVDYIQKQQIQEDIRKAHELRPDAIIACMHWGLEYKSLPNQEQRNLAEWLLSQGVTHIIGSHPHVIQPIEVRTQGCNRHAIVYSLGNFISNMSAPNTDGGLVVTLTLEKSATPRIITPHITTRSFSTELDTLLRPICRLVDCDYTLVWTARPELSKKKNFQLIPDNKPLPPLPQPAINKFNNYIKSAQRMMQQHNIGLEARKK